MEIGCESWKGDYCVVRVVSALEGSTVEIGGWTCSDDEIGRDFERSVAVVVWTSWAESLLWLRIWGLLVVSWSISMIGSGSG